MKRFLERQSLSRIKQFASASFSCIAENETSSPTMRRLNFFARSSGANRPKSAGRAQRLDPRRKSGIAAATLSTNAEKGAALQKAKTDLRIPPTVGLGIQTPGLRLASVKESETEVREEEKEELKTELREVPGVGPKSEQLLCSKGITTIASLQHHFHETCSGFQALFVEYLHKDVGIMHSRHCQAIADFVRDRSEKVDCATERITLSVEGNISSGKSTFLEWMQDDHALEIRDLCEVVQEPVNQWQCLAGREEYNLLEEFYNNPEKHAYAFQNYVFLTRMITNRKTYDGEKPLRIIERSVFSDRMVFVRAVHEAKWMSDMQLTLYDSWFNPLLKETPGLIPDGFIYLRTQPATCMKRLKRRMRSEEIRVNDGYLEGLHAKHEDWFAVDEWKDYRSKLLPQTQQGVLLQAHEHDPWNEIKPPKEIEDDVIWLSKSGVVSPSPSMRNGNLVEVPNEVKAFMTEVPALVLDCDADINVETDIDAKKAYARKVRHYFDFVRKWRKQRRASLPFYAWHRSEDLRRKWDLVNALSETEFREVTKRAAEYSEQKERMRAALV